MRSPEKYHLKITIIIIIIIIKKKTYCVLLEVLKNTSKGVSGPLSYITPNVPKFKDFFYHCHLVFCRSNIYRHFMKQL